MTNLNRSDDNDLLVALRHPVRRDILREMAGEKAISPREIASALRQPLSNVSYHVRVLADCAAVSLVSTKPVRGSMQHFYRIAIEAPWARQVLGLDSQRRRPRGGEFDRARDLAATAMDEIDDSWTPAAADAATESAVLQRLLDLHPVQVTAAELVREVGGESPSFAERDAIERAVRDLSGAGLLHSHDAFVLPTRAALRFSELLDR